MSPLEMREPHSHPLTHPAPGTASRAPWTLNKQPRGPAQPGQGLEAVTKRRKRRGIWGRFPGGPSVSQNHFQSVFFFPVSEAEQVINLSATSGPRRPEPAATYVVWLPRNLPAVSPSQNPAASPQPSRRCLELLRAFLGVKLKKMNGSCENTHFIRVAKYRRRGGGPAANAVPVYRDPRQGLGGLDGAGSGAREPGQTGAGSRWRL